MKTTAETIQRLEQSLMIGYENHEAQRLINHSDLENIISDLRELARCREALEIYLKARPQCPCTSSDCEMAVARKTAQAILTPKADIVGEG